MFAHDGLAFMGREGSAPSVGAISTRGCGFSFEVRHDDKAAGSGEVKADVFYDDLYVGPAAANPNRPEG